LEIFWRYFGDISVNSRPVTQKRISKGFFGIDLESREAWMSILGLIFTILVLLVAAPRLLVVLFPLMSFLVALFLYSRYSILYVGFTWWMWFLAPFVRRLIDYRCGTITFSSYHLTSMLVTSVCGITLYKKLPNTQRTGGLPFLLCFGSVFYAFIVGLIRQSENDPGQVIIIAMGWMCPMMFGFYLYSQWREYPTFRDNIQRVFLWAAIIMGTYGIVQFVVAPPWDCFPLIQKDGLYGSSWMGTPKPFGIRVWSTMTYPFTFALNLMPGLILLFISKSKFRYLAISVGYLSFLLTKSRTAWYSYILALSVFFFSLKSRFQLRLFIAIASVVLIVIPLATIEPFSEVIGSRIETIYSIDEDHSYQSRLTQFDETINHAITEYVGWGLMGIQGVPKGFSATGEITDRASGLDNGYLVLIVSFGWLGLIPYLSGWGMMLYRLFSAPASQLDVFAMAARAVAFSSIARMVTTNVTVGEFALPIWGFLGIAMAAQKYFSYQEFIAETAKK
jgi:hypothetical protein